MATINDVLNPIVDDVFHSIEITLNDKTKKSCLALLMMYTETFGALYSIKPKYSKNDTNLFNVDFPRDSKLNFKKCLEYMGTSYVELYEKMDEYKDSKGISRNLCDVLRHGVIHEFTPKITYSINTKDDASLGIDYTPHLMIKINLKQYFQDFKKGYEKWKNEIDNNFERSLNVLHVFKQSFPPQGGIGTIIDSRNGDEYILKS